MSLLSSAQNLNEHNLHNRAGKPARKKEVLIKKLAQRGTRRKEMSIHLNKHSLNINKKF